MTGKKLDICRSVLDVVHCLPGNYNESLSAKWDGCGSSSRYITMFPSPSLLAFIIRYLKTKRRQDKTAPSQHVALAIYWRIISQTGNSKWRPRALRIKAQYRSRRSSVSSKISHYTLLNNPVFPRKAEGSSPQTTDLLVSPDTV
jgi:hypothetical protein